MRWTNRFIVPIGRALGAAAFCAALSSTGASASAQSRTAYVFDGRDYAFTQTRTVGGAVGVALDDPALRRLLDALGASVSQNADRYVLITTAEPVVISFAIGDRRYDVGPVPEEAPFAPFVDGGTTYVPLFELLHALDLDVKTDGGERVLQPQLASLETQSTANAVKVVAHAGIPLAGRISAQSTDRTSVTFDGVGSPLQRVRRFSSGPVREIDVTVSGTVRTPQTTVTLLYSGAAPRVQTTTDDQRDYVIAVGGFARSAPVARAQPPAQPAPQQQQQPSQTTPAPATSSASVVGVDATPSQDGMRVDVRIDGNATYEWHRLRPPDNRFWLDVHDARLAVPPRDTSGNDAVPSVRIHQVNPQTVRVALNLADYYSVIVTPTASGATIAVSATVADASVPRAGSGTTGSDAVANAPPQGAADGWKFAASAASAPPYVPRNPHLIVIDPGHGGSDPGSIRGAFAEKTLTLDMSRRLRDILVARGWQVMMTRDGDRDVFGPNASDRDELQARDDVANQNGARFFISVHVNSFINSGPRGTTTYYFKPSDLPLARAIQRRLMDGGLETKDDGIQKDRLFVLNHSLMPAALVETAFISNPDDYARLADPQWRQRCAQAIADGIDDFAQTTPSGRGD